MDKMCNKLELEDLNKPTASSEESENSKEASRCESPVFKCLNPSKLIRRVNSNSSDYDIPSYQINQSTKSRTSSKCENEMSDSVLPFSPILSPIPVTSSLQFQPPSIHSLGTIVKNVDRSCKNTFGCSVVKSVKVSAGLFETLGMTDKDVSWVSSMASPPPPVIPGSDFNTIERATFFPEDKFQNIQPRALFSPTHDDDFGCQPITFSSDSEDEAYKSNIRLSDVCATLNKLEVRSLDLILETGENNSGPADVQKKGSCPNSPIIQTEIKKPEEVKKQKSTKRKGVLVNSPTVEDQYEFSVGERLLEMSSGVCQSTTFIEDDSFQSISFSGIDELCKTLVNVTGQSDSSSLSKPSDCDRTLVNDSSVSNSVTREKQFYESKTIPEVFPVSSMDDLHSYAAALEEGDVSIPGSSKIDKSFADKGIVRFDLLEKDSSTKDATKRLHSELSEEWDHHDEKKFKQVEEEPGGWDSMKKYLSESQLNVSEGEIFRTVENLEKTLASQESKNTDKEEDAEASVLQNEEAKVAEVSGNVGEEDTKDSGSSEISEDGDLLCSMKSYLNLGTGSGFKTASGSKISVSEKSLTKVRDILKDCEGPPEGGGFKRWGLPGGPRKIQVSTEALERAKAFMADCQGGPPEGFSTCSGKRVQVSAEALKKGKALMAKCDESCGKNWMKGFSTGSGKQIQVAAEALEKAKALMSTCEENPKETSDELASIWVEELAQETAPEFHEKKPEASKPSEPGKGGQTEIAFQPGAFPGFSTASNNKVQVSAAALEKARALLSKVDEESENLNVKPDAKLSVDVTQAFPSFSTASGRKVTVSEAALAKAREYAVRWEEKPPDDSGNFDCGDSFKASLKSADESKTLSQGKQETLSTTSGIDESAVKDPEDDWEEIIPSWLHVYNTSPSIASDRLGVSPLVSHEDGRSSKPEREYIVTSPVLGTSDRFYKKVKRKKLRFEDSKPEEKPKGGGFTVPFKDPGRKPSLKRNSNLDVDFSAPFKKTKFAGGMTEDVGLDVKERRKRGREAQERAIKGKQGVKPVKGSHLSRKCSEKQVNWAEAVGGASPEVHPEDHLRAWGVKEDVLSVRIGNAADFKFAGDFFGSKCLSTAEEIPVGDECLLIPDDENRLGVEEFKRAFLASPGVQPDLVPPGWVENHYKWIVWKLSHYERSFPRRFGGRCLTPNNVALQLKYRYDREIDRSERSALRKILERDDTPAKRIVLCVCGIKKAVNAGATIYEVDLTDGWYSCPARSDPAMTRLVEEGKVSIGTKLVIQGATLVNCEQGVSPLEISGDVHLKISTNSTRRIRWDSKLGYQRNPENFPVSLRSVLPQGGTISRLDVILVRIYPMLYMEKTADGHHVTRNRRSEEKAEAEYRKVQEKRWESIRSEIQSEMRNSNRSLSDGEDLCQLMEGSSGPSALEELVSADQRRRLQNFQQNQSDRFNRELAERIESRLRKEKLDRRDVSELLRAKVVDLRKPDYNNPAVLSVWKPNEDLVRLLAEGKVFSVTNASVSNSSRSYKALQINTTRQTQYREIVRSVKYPGRRLTRLGEVSSRVCPAFEEVDLVGVVALVRDVAHGSRMSQVVYLTDLESHFVGIVFWGSCKDYGWENVLRTRSVVACSNLQWKKNYCLQEVPSLHVSENSTFTENPRQGHLKGEAERLRGMLPQDVDFFLSRCEEEITTKLEDSRRSPRGGGTASPHGPTASSTPIKPFPTSGLSDEAEPSPIQKRIEKLQSYGEAPPLVPLIVSNGIRRRPKKK